MSYCIITRQWLPAKQMKVAYDSKGNKLLVAQEVQTTHCDYCERDFIEEIGGMEFIQAHRHGEIQTICEDCKDEFGYCEDCGDWYHNDDLIRVDDGCFCENCIDNHARECERCGEYHWLDDMIYTEDGYWVCRDCFDCYGYVCPNCGRSWYYSDSIYEDEYGDEVCEACADDALRFIHNYSYKPYPRFHKTGEEKVKYQGENFGFEIEVSGSCSEAENFLEAFGDKAGDDIYLKKDGSVAGFEIVTHPMTRDWFYKEFMPKLTNGMNYLRSHHFRGHNTAGIHIHVSENYITDKMLKRLVLLLYPKSDKTYRKWLAITQRHDEEMSHWSSMRSVKEKECKRMYFDKLDDSTSKPCVSPSRYTAINITNSTVEFRIFNSNLRPERIAKNAEVIMSLLDFSKTNIIPTMTNYLRYVDKHKRMYKYLFDFLIEKHIYQSMEQKETVQKITEAVGDVLNTTLTPAELTELLQQQNITTTTEIDDEDERRAVCA